MFSLLGLSYLLLLYPPYILAAPTHNSPSLASGIPALVCLLIVVIILISLLSFKLSFLRRRRSEQPQRRPQSQPRTRFSDASEKQQNIGSQHGFIVGLLGSPYAETKLSLDSTSSGQNYSVDLTVSQISGSLSSRKSKESGISGSFAAKYGLRFSFDSFRAHTRAKDHWKQRQMEQSALPPCYRSPLPQDFYPAFPQVKIPILGSRAQNRSSLVPQKISHPYSSVSSPPMRSPNLVKDQPLQLTIHSSSPLSPLNLLQASFDTPSDPCVTSASRAPTSLLSPIPESVFAAEVMSPFLATPPQTYNSIAHRYCSEQDMINSKPPSRTESISQLESDFRFSETPCQDRDFKGKSWASCELEEPTPSFDSTYTDIGSDASPPLPPTTPSTAAAMIMSRSWAKPKASSRHRRTPALRPSPLRNTIIADNTNKETQSAQRDSMELLSMIRDLVEEASTWEDSVFLDNNFKNMIEESSMQLANDYEEKVKSLASHISLSMSEADITLVASMSDETMRRESEAKSLEETFSQCNFHAVDVLPTIPDLDEEVDCGTIPLIWQYGDASESVGVAC